jgi:hypothetical protein
LKQQSASRSFLTEFHYEAPKENVDDIHQIASVRNFFTIQTQRIADLADFPKVAKRQLSMKCHFSKPKGTVVKHISGRLAVTSGHLPTPRR